MLQLLWVLRGLHLMGMMVQKKLLLITLVQQSKNCFPTHRLFPLNTQKEDSLSFMNAPRSLVLIPHSLFALQEACSPGEKHVGGHKHHQFTLRTQLQAIHEIKPKRTSKNAIKKRLQIGNKEPEQKNWMNTK